MKIHEAVSIQPVIEGNDYCPYLVRKETHVPYELIASFLFQARSAGVIGPAVEPDDHRKACPACKSFGNEDIKIKAVFVHEAHVAVTSDLNRIGFAFCRIIFPAVKFIRDGLTEGKITYGRLGESYSAELPAAVLYDAGKCCAFSFHRNLIRTHSSSSGSSRWALISPFSTSLMKASTTSDVSWVPLISFMMPMTLLKSMCFR